MAVHRECPEGTACHIRHLAKTRDISLNAAIRSYHESSGISVRTLERWVWPSKNDESTDRPDGRKGAEHTTLEDRLRHLQKYLKSATTNLIAINYKLRNMDATGIDGMEGLVLKLDLANFHKQYVEFSQYVRQKPMKDIESEKKVISLAGRKGGR